MTYPVGLREEDLKNKVARDWFGSYDWTPIVGNIDFCVEDSEYNIAYLWAEAKKGTSEDIYASFVQLIITIGKARTFEKHLPPAFLGAFDAEKIAFVPYHAIMAVFSQSDFKWNVTPSDHGTKEFRQLYEHVKSIIEVKSLLFRFNEDEKRLRAFIKANFKPGQTDFQQIEITRNNFVSIYYQWLEKVRPSITANWEGLKKKGIIDADFYLADVMSRNNLTLGEKLFVLLKSTYYEFARAMDVDLGVGDAKYAGFRDKQQAHTAFWSIYKRPPDKEFRAYILSRRDLLVPMDVRQYTGAFFTPPQWVALSQEYLSKALGPNWQDEYYVWDCAAGTGNLLAGLTEPDRIWASTLLQGDVDVMRQCIDSKALNLLKGNVFQFDFLNDSFDKLPANLRAIVKDPEKRKKLVVYINPPYAEATNSKTRHAEKSRNKPGVSQSGEYTYKKYKEVLGRGVNEVYAQFLARIYDELHGVVLGHFSTLKIVLSVNFGRFREFFRARLKRLFIIPSNTFDNVSGQFAIGFYVWETGVAANRGREVRADIYDSAGAFAGVKTFFCPNQNEIIMHWLQDHYDKTSARLAYVVRGPSDFQNSSMVFISLAPSQAMFDNSRTHDITKNNLLENAIFFAMRRIMPPTWFNKSESFLYPADTWADDVEFQNDCLAWTLFNNRISMEHGVNHWIPFKRKEVGASGAFTSTFMTDYMAGKLGGGKATDLTGAALSSAPTSPLAFSPAAQAVFDAGRELWRYYHKQPGAEPDAALYDIKAHFQGRDAKGRMNAKSGDDDYNSLMADLRVALKRLAGQIKPKVYEHGFLKR